MTPWWCFATACSIFRDGLVIIETYLLKWRICSILPDGLVWELFHPSRWLIFKSAPSFEMARWVFEEARAFASESVSSLPSSCFSGGWFFEGSLQIFFESISPFSLPTCSEVGAYCFGGAWSLGEGCNVLQKRLPPPLRPCTEDLCDLRLGF